MKSFFLCLLMFVGVGLSWAERSSSATFRAVEIDSKIQIGYGVTVAEVNGDDKPDILLADKNQIVWYENPGWEKRVIAENLTERDHVCIAAQDIDGDGKCEIALGAGWNPGDTVNSGAIFYLIAPEDRKQRWEAVPLPHEPTVHRMRWLKNADEMWSLLVLPLHGRGNNAATGEGAGVRVLAYKMPVDPRSEWKTELWDESLHKTHNFDLFQSDEDHADEILLGGKEGVVRLDRVASKTETTVLTASQGGGVGEVRSGKLGGGKRFFATVEPMHGNRLIVYVEFGSGEDATWRPQVLDDSLIDAHALACADFAQLGSDQIVVGWRAMNRVGVKVGIKLFTPVDADGSAWSETLVDDNNMACEDLCVADLNDDGALDIVASGRGTKNVKIYFNERSVEE